MTTEHFVHVS